MKYPVTIEPHSTTRVIASIRRTHHFEPGNTVVVNQLPKPYRFEQSQLEVNVNVTTIDYKRRVAVEVMNNSDSEVRLRQGTLLGKVNQQVEKKKELVLTK